MPVSDFQVQKIKYSNQLTMLLTLEQLLSNSSLEVDWKSKNKTKTHKIKLSEWPIQGSSICSSLTDYIKTPDEICITTYKHKSY